MSIPRKHHFLPKFYLKNWADESGRVWAFSRPNGELICRHVYPSGTGYANHLYSMPSSRDARERETLEIDFFGKVDREAAQVLGQMRARASLTKSDRDAWSRFLMSLMHRSPRRVRFLRNSMRQADGRALAALEHEYATRRGPGDPATYAEFIATADPAFTEPWEIKMIMSLSDSALVGSRLNGMDWDVISITSRKHGLLTNEAPILGGRIGLADGIIVVPLGPSDLFLATNTFAVRRRVFKANNDGKLELRINEEVAKVADDLVIATSSSHLRFIDKRMPRRAPDELGTAESMYKNLSDTSDWRP